jgi:hypothetical protein
MTGPWAVVATPQFSRLARRLTRQHPEFAELYRSALAILAEDPANVSRSHPIRKLTDVPPGQGQFRLRLRRFRIRYDVEGRTVLLKQCGLRREDSY